MIYPFSLKMKNISKLRSLSKINYCKMKKWTPKEAHMMLFILDK